MSKIKGVVDSITGGRQADAAARRAAGEQVAAGNRAIATTKEARDQARGDFQSFADLGQRNVGGLESLVNDPNAQLKFVQDNPFFKALTDETTNRLLQNQAASGKVGSGGTAEALQNSLLLLGNDLVQQGIANRRGLVDLGFAGSQGQANASLGAGSQIANIQLGKGNATAAGIIGGRNAINQGRSDLISTASSLLGSYLAGAGAGAGAGADADAGAGADADASGVGGLASLFACDIRLKENIQEVGKLNNGLPLYLFNYKNDPDKKLHINVMAQDVEKVNPSAVQEIDGYKYVNMEKIWQ